jgi:hypothetical protein
LCMAATSGCGKVAPGGLADELARRVRVKPEYRVQQFDLGGRTIQITVCLGTSCSDDVGERERERERELML